MSRTAVKANKWRVIPHCKATNNQLLATHNFRSAKWDNSLQTAPNTNISSFSKPPCRPWYCRIFHPRSMVFLVHLCCVLSIKHACLCTENEEGRSNVGGSECEVAEQTERGEETQRIYRIPFSVLHAWRDKFLETNTPTVYRVVSGLPSNSWHKLNWDCTLQLNKCGLTWSEIFFYDLTQLWVKFIHQAEEQQRPWRVPLTFKWGSSLMLTGLHLHVSRMSLIYIWMCSKILFHVWILAFHCFYPTTMSNPFCLLLFHPQTGSF